MLGLQSLSSFELGQRRSLTLENCTTAIDRRRSLLPLCWNMLGNARGTQPKQRKRIIMQGGRYIHSTSPTRGRDKGLVWFQIFYYCLSQRWNWKMPISLSECLPTGADQSFKLGACGLPINLCCLLCLRIFHSTLQLLLLMWYAALMSPDKILLLLGRLGGPSPVPFITLLTAPLIILLWLDE